MKKAFCLFLLFFVCRSARLLYADTYTVDNLPMVYLQDKTKHVVNPDGILFRTDRTANGQPAISVGNGEGRTVRGSRSGTYRRRRML